MVSKENWKEIEPVEIKMHPGDFRKTFDGTNVRITITTIQPGPGTPNPHRHEHEQINWLSEGSGVIYIDNKKIEMKAGDIVSIPPNVEHYFLPEGKEKLTMIEVFSPIPVVMGSK